MAAFKRQYTKHWHNNPGWHMLQSVRSETGSLVSFCEHRMSCLHSVQLQSATTEVSWECSSSGAAKQSSCQKQNMHHMNRNS